MAKYDDEFKLKIVKAFLTGEKKVGVDLRGNGGYLIVILLNIGFVIMKLTVKKD
ncbi:hypothetical protein GGQ92_001158 [Gracilibacillus halotolerans]|uniref:Transposase n=1 Tax=Gracilibacillus halotolerans TaxID=74386 RepID=A0A841RMJ4_9BACI|nr:hypothetical protein [Gracilibacillus halotolerans]MBB6512375.1 hypothetical protein [Gracilibacillus halotolerans]